MRFSDKQLAAIIKVVDSMVQADAVVKDSEVELKEKEYARLGVGENHRNKAEAMRTVDAWVTIAHLTYSKKEYVAALLVAIMVVDNELDIREHIFWNTISAVCEFPTRCIAKAMQIWQSGKHGNVPFNSLPNII